MRFRAPIVVLLALSTALLGMVCVQVQPALLKPLPGGPGGRAVSYEDEVKPVLENRCVVCHGCYDAPCQLKLESFAGVERGASKASVYYAARLSEGEQTRLGIDARSPEEWREREFYSVLEGEGSEVPHGLLLRMLALGHTHPFPADQPLPDSVSIDITRTLSCPTDTEFDAYAAEHPLGGMPYGTAPLSDDELRSVASWVLQGADPPAAPARLPPAVAAEVVRWESFLNGASLKQKITSRYLYEHWYLAHLDLGVRSHMLFFRIIRSRTAPGEPADEIATRRPYDDAGPDPFWYRLVPIEQTIVHKTHIVYRLSAAKRRRLTELFLDAKWTPTRLPGHSAEEASNPFVTFDQIPARSRYQFLLDDAQYFVMTFIRGPVCRGQTAVDVIQDHFFVTFVDPDHDVSITDPAFLPETQHWLDLPAARGSSFNLGGVWLEHIREQKKYMDRRAEFYDAQNPGGWGASVDWIWDGDGRNRNAQLTVFRHFDSATVLKGFLGEIPKTAWVIDFPIFERIYYDLVAGFDVFGSVTHQASTRLYMDHLRMQSENNFLAFMLAAERESMRDSWYVGATRQLTYFRVNAVRSLGHETRVSFRTQDPKRELIEMILARNPRVSGPPDRLNRCRKPPCDRPAANASERRAERALQRLAGIRGPWVALLPDLMFLRVRSGSSDVVYTLVHNKMHSNVAVMFGEEERRRPEEDTVTVARGTLGSYPNFLFELPVDEIEEFVMKIKALQDETDRDEIVGRWGVRRTSPRFWSNFDWIHRDFRRRDPVEAGLFDLNRYKNP